MAPVPIAQTRLFGKVSKASLGSSSKDECAPPRRKTYAWLGAKRKRDDDDNEERESSKLSSSTPLSKKVEEHLTLECHVQAADIRSQEQSCLVRSSRSQQKLVPAITWL
jgi:hypothetical protein